MCPLLQFSLALRQVAKLSCHVEDRVHTRAEVDQTEEVRLCILALAAQVGSIELESAQGNKLQLTTDLLERSDAEGGHSGVAIREPVGVAFLRARFAGICRRIAHSASAAGPTRKRVLVSPPLRGCNHTSRLLMPMLQVHEYSDDFLDHFGPIDHELRDGLEGSFCS